jgi:serine/threonine protein kinase
MNVPLLLLKHIARAYLNHIGMGALGEVAFGMAEDVMAAWRSECDGRARKAELEAIAQATGDQIKQAVREAVDLVASDRLEADRQAVAGYLIHVPGAIRRTLRRASDPSGRSLPSGFEMKEARDLAAILPDRLPRFRPGDRPWSNVDRVLVDLLGVGGFGEVWKAINPSRPGAGAVAMKFCTVTAAEDKLLRHEAGLLDRIMEVGPQPGIVVLQNTYLSAEPPCLEYEYVAGGELTGVIRESRGRGGISPRSAARIVERLAGTVGYFHRLRPPIVHRDLKPANILVRADAAGRIALKVADFGIGGVAAGREIERSRTHASPGGPPCSISRGSYTPLYASPEQVRGAAPDPRDDVHALGVIWFQLLCGDPTVGAPTGLDWAEDLAARRMGPEQVRVLGSCFSSNPARRPADAGSLAAEIASMFPPEGDGGVVDPPGVGGRGAVVTPVDPRPARVRDPEPVDRPVTGRTFHLEMRGITAEGYPDGRKFVVRSSSQARLAAVPKIPRNLADIREDLKRRNILVEAGGKLVLRGDYTFDSSSTAAGVLLGGSESGPRVWRDETGKSLRDIQEEARKGPGPPPAGPTG